MACTKKASRAVPPHHAHEGHFGNPAKQFVGNTKGSTAPNWPPASIQQLAPGPAQLGFTWCAQDTDLLCSLLPNHLIYRCTANPVHIMVHSCQMRPHTNGGPHPGGLQCRLCSGSRAHHTVRQHICHQHKRMVGDQHNQADCRHSQDSPQHKRMIQVTGHMAASRHAPVCAGGKSLTGLSALRADKPLEHLLGPAS